MTIPVESRVLGAYFWRSPKETDITIILIHGWGQSQSFWANLIHPYLDQGYNVLTVDLPGFGQNSVLLDGFDLDAYADWVAEVVGIYDLKEAIVVGHSFGGRVSIKYAAKHPIRGLILYNSSGIKGGLWSYPKALIMSVLSSLAPNTLYWVWSHLFHPQEYQNISIIKKAKSVHMVRVYTNTHLDGEEIHLVQDMDVIVQKKIPTLVCCGDQDKIVSIHRCKALSEALHTTCVVLPGGHCCHWENTRFLEVSIPWINAIH